MDWRRKLLLLLLVAALSFVVVDLFTGQHTEAALTDFLNWVEDLGAAGPFVFAAVYVACVVAFVPGSLLTLGAGYVFARAFGQATGIAVAFVAVLVGATVGACLGFLLGRYVMRETVREWIARNRVLLAVDGAIGGQGLRVMILLRLSPIVPFTVSNYALGVTSLAFRDFALGSVGMIPGTLAYVYIGSALQSLSGGSSSSDASGSSTVQLVLLILGVLATIVAVVLISRYARKALNEALQLSDIRSDSVVAAGDGEASGSGSAARASVEVKMSPQ